MAASDHAVQDGDARCEVSEEDFKEANCVGQRKGSVFNAPKKLWAAQADGAAHALGSSDGGAHMWQPLALVRVKELLVRASHQHAGNLPADVARVVQTGREALRAERRHAVRSIADESDPAAKHPLRRDATVERVLHLQSASCKAVLCNDHHRASPRG